jgi:hypothetical protein
MQTLFRNKSLPAIFRPLAIVESNKRDLTSTRYRPAVYTVALEPGRVEQLLALIALMLKYSVDLYLMLIQGISYRHRIPQLSWRSLLRSCQLSIGEPGYSPTLILNYPTNSVTARQRHHDFVWLNLQVPCKSAALQEF